MSKLIIDRIKVLRCMGRDEEKVKRKYEVIPKN